MNIGGRTRSSRGKRLMHLVGHLHQKYQDPTGGIRHRGRSGLTDPWHYSPNLPAIPVDGLVNVWDFENDHDTDTTNVWDETASGSGTGLTVQDVRAGFAKVINGGADNNHYFYQAKYETGLISDGKDMWLRTRFIVGNADEADFFIGLCARLASGTLFANRVDSIGFYTEDGSETINIEASKDGTATQTATSQSLADATEITAEIHVSSDGKIYFKINGEDVGSITTNLPDDTELAFSFGIQNGAASANTLQVGRTILLQDE